MSGKWLRNVKRVWLPLILAVAGTPAMAADIELVSGAKLNTLVGSFDDVFDQSYPYYDLFFELIPPANTNYQCAGGNHINLPNVWGFQSPSSAGTLNTAKMFSLLNVAWVTDMTVSLVGDSANGTSCSDDAVKYVVIHKNVI